jgi:hypothetical protein
MVEELAELGGDEVLFSARGFWLEPEHPIPEMSIESCQVVGTGFPGWLMNVRHVGEDQVDLRRSRQDQHPTLLVAQAIPLLSERLERREQIGKSSRDRAEVASIDQEVPVGIFSRNSCRTRAHELNAANSGMPGDSANNTLGKVQSGYDPTNSTRTGSVNAPISSPRRSSSRTARRPSSP